MAIIVAEYLGQRIESNEDITPFPYQEAEEKGIQFEKMGICPFNGLTCKKMDKGTNARFPVCSLRRNEELYIICEHRLISTTRKTGYPLSPYQEKMLLALAREIFSPDVTSNQLLYKTEVYVASAEEIEENESAKRKKFGRADYMLSVTPDVTKTYGPRKLIIEVQGGGETSKTGNMTTQLKRWTNAEHPTNRLLSTPLDVGLIQTNAWRRLQEQILTKGSVAAASGYGFVACVGTHVFDQVKTKLNNFADLPVLSKEEDTWDTALVAYREDTSETESIITNAIPLEVDYSRIIYTRYTELANILIRRGEAVPAIFAGKWWKLTGEAVSENGIPLEEIKKPRRSRKKTSPSNETQDRQTLF